MRSTVWRPNAKFILAVLVANLGISGRHQGLALPPIQTVADSAYMLAGFESRVRKSAVRSSCLVRVVSGASCCTPLQAETGYGSL